MPGADVRGVEQRSEECLRGWRQAENRVRDGDTVAVHRVPEGRAHRSLQHKAQVAGLPPVRPGSGACGRHNHADGRGHLRLAPHGVKGAAPGTRVAGVAGKDAGRFIVAAHPGQGRQAERLDGILDNHAILHRLRQRREEGAQDGLLRRRARLGFALVAAGARALGATHAPVLACALARGADCDNVTGHAVHSIAKMIGIMCCVRLVDAGTAASKGRRRRAADCFPGAHSGVDAHIHAAHEHLSTASRHRPRLPWSRPSTRLSSQN